LTSVDGSYAQAGSADVKIPPSSRIFQHYRPFRLSFDAGIADA
jgi:hypothetical protein